MPRNRRSSMLSFRKVSSGSIPRVDATETAKEKAAFHINTKADPTKAINEAEPATRNALEASTVESIRNLEHRDADGNIITDPDRSNPTRPRLERPLDTVRSFEAAIDGSYNRRASFKADSPNASPHHNNRRSAYLQGYQSQQRSPADGGGYYAGRNGGSRPDSHVENHWPPSNLYGNRTPPNQYNSSSGRRAAPRNQMESPYYGNVNGQGIYPAHGHQQSNDTVASASNGSHATDQWGNSTDPSSENSSIDRVQASAKPDLGDSYGFNGFGGGPQLQGPILEEHGYGAPGYGQPGYGQDSITTGNGLPYQGNSAAPLPPPHAPLKNNAPRVPMKLSSASAQSKMPPVSVKPSPSANSEKRRSWLKKRFSRG